jgi:hypothetical protein
MQQAKDQLASGLLEQQALGETIYLFLYVLQQLHMKQQQ